MLVKTNKIREIKLLFQAIGDLVDDVSLKFGDKFIEFEGLDKANIAYCRLKILSLFFDEYKSDDEPIAFKVGDMVDYLGFPKEGDTIVLSISEDKASMVMEILGKTRQVYSMPLLSSIVMPQIPESKLVDAIKNNQILTQWVASVKPDSERFDMSVKNLNKLGKSKIAFKVKENMFSMKKLEDLKKGEIFLGKFDTANNQELSASFNADYIEKFCKLTPITENIEIYLKQDFPILFNLNKLNAFSIFYMMAPIVETSN